jgi:hypothetical protein
MPCIEGTRQALLAWLEAPAAWAAQRAIEAVGVPPDDVCARLHAVTEDPASAADLVSLVTEARVRASLPDDTVAIERWLLIRQAADALNGEAMETLGDAAQRLTCAEIASLMEDDPATRRMLAVSGIRFREFAKVVTGRRFSAGLFFWDECGVRRSWLPKVPLRNWAGCGRMLIRMGGLGPIMYPHLNPRRSSSRLEEPAISSSYAVMAESIDRRADLRGFAAASWLWSPDTHRVSPHLAAVMAPILGHGGFVTTIGPASPDCGVFARSDTRRRLYHEGTFTPTIGLVLWPRAEMVHWWRASVGMREFSRAGVLPTDGPEGVAAP